MTFKYKCNRKTTSRSETFIYKKTKTLTIVEELKHHTYKLLCRYTSNIQFLGDFESKKIRTNLVKYTIENTIKSIQL